MLGGAQLPPSDSGNESWSRVATDPGKNELVFGLERYGCPPKNIDSADDLIHGLPDEIVPVLNYPAPLSAI